MTGRETVDVNFRSQSISANMPSRKDDTEYAIRCEALDTPPQWLPTHCDNVLGFEVEIDGKTQHIAALTAARWHRGAAQVVEGVTKQISGSQGTFSRFKFSAVNALDDANAQKVKDDLKRAKHIGLIRVRVFRAISLHRTTDKGAIIALGEKRDLSIAEKAMKGRAVSHGTTLSAATKANVGEVLDVYWIDPISTPFAIFDFHYRSKDALRSEMIIPRTASPSVPPSLDGVEAIEQRVKRKSIALLRRDLRR
ncbi:hypothetical protein GE09DRAFT_38713 [Coniochaeta sp. 2T2.1]|nr:hypothetical protein GE09DRAFT_38713 [Coniochaeta sp. 2T2.1]